MNQFYRELSFKLSNNDLKTLRNLLDIYNQSHFDRIHCTDLVQETIVDIEYLKTIPFYYDLQKQFQCKPLLIRFNPKIWFKWHRDSRFAAINTVLDDYQDCITMFKHLTNEETVHESGNLTVLKYKLGHPVLLNTKQPHCVVNLESRPRYVFSLGFPHHTYERVIFHLMRHKLI